jgi:nitroreductase
MTLAENPVASLRSLLEARYSCRAYRDDPVPVDVVREILEVAQRTPSWCNTQPWHVTVTSGEETERFRAHLSAQVLESRGTHDIEPPARYEGVYRERRRASGFALYDSLGIAYDDKEGRTRQMLENYRFFGAPHVAIITSEARLGPYGYVDCGAYVSNFLLAAANLGVATIAQASVAMYSNVVREHLSIPDTRHVVCAISFGYADDKHPANQFRTERASLDEATDLRGF